MKCYNYNPGYIFLLLMTNLAYAAIPIDGIYAGFMGTISSSSSSKYNIINPFTNIVTINSIDYLVGGGVGGQIGYRYCKFRLEGEVLYVQNVYSSARLGNRELKKHLTPTNNYRQQGKTAVTAGFLNLYYELYNEDDDPIVFPYIGIGMGYGQARNNFSIYTANNLISNLLFFKTHNNKSTVALQLIAGLNYMATDALSFAIDYRYIATENKSFTTKSLALPLIKTSFQLNTLNLILNYSFDSDLF